MYNKIKQLAYRYADEQIRDDVIQDTALLFLEKKIANPTWKQVREAIRNAVRGYRKPWRGKKEEVGDYQDVSAKTPHDVFLDDIYPVESLPLSTIFADLELEEDILAEIVRLITEEYSNEQIIDVSISNNITLYQVKLIRDKLKHYFIEASYLSNSIFSSCEANYDEQDLVREEAEQAIGVSDLELSHENYILIRQWEGGSRSKKCQKNKKNVKKSQNFSEKTFSMGRVLAIHVYFWDIKLTKLTDIVQRLCNGETNLDILKNVSNINQLTVKALRQFNDNLSDEIAELYDETKRQNLPSNNTDIQSLDDLRDYLKSLKLQTADKISPSGIPYILVRDKTICCGKRNKLAVYFNEENSSVTFCCFGCWGKGNLGHLYRNLRGNNLTAAIANIIGKNNSLDYLVGIHS